MLAPIAKIALPFRLACPLSQINSCISTHQQQYTALQKIKLFLFAIYYVLLNIFLYYNN